ncbi:MAG: hypothetical protein K2M50_03250, partial [Treponemataceae bacterium]|nr:hypothetical protein [Treponemataceae bacterium]
SGSWAGFCFKLQAFYNREFCPPPPPKKKKREIWTVLWRMSVVLQFVVGACFCLDGILFLLYAFYRLICTSVKIQQKDSCLASFMKTPFP